jgi:hypothetical protein
MMGYAVYGAVRDVRRSRHLERWIKAERLVFLFHPLRGLFVPMARFKDCPIRGNNGFCFIGLNG